MKQPPAIVVQLIHIEGPLKGDIQEFTVPEISIGRNPSCTVRFPKDLAVVSRQHALITREGNRFKVTDQSSNGTFLNGKPVKEAYLKDGDVLMLAEGGPKISFLTQVTAEPAEIPVVADATIPESPSYRQPYQPPPEPPRMQAPPAAPKMQPPPSAPLWPSQKQASEGFARPAIPSAPLRPEPASSFAGGAPQDVPAQRIKRPLIIQYGPTLRSFNELPVTIGRGMTCDFVLSHPAIFERHAQIFFHQEQYWIKDLSGKNPILINGRPVDRQAMLDPDCRLSLSAQGPDFRFLGGGRLAEMEPAVPETPIPQPGANEPAGSGPRKTTSSASEGKDLGGIMKRFWKK